MTVPLSAPNNPAPVTADHWPYPRWIAHRGAGKLAPENTLAAFRLGAQHGYRMFECDVKLSADGVPFLLHDATLERTTNGQGTAGLLAWHELARLDAGTWHSRAFAGEPLPTLDAVARYCLANALALNIEIKPTPGDEARTGKVVALAARAAWANGANCANCANCADRTTLPTLATLQTTTAGPVSVRPPPPPLLTSFQPEALAAAQAAAPELPRGLLLDTLWDGWLSCAQELRCVAIVCNHLLWNTDTVAAARNAGLRTLSYTVNDPAAAQRLIELGTDGIITDRVDLFSPAG